jgi:hypothetical protein
MGVTGSKAAISSSPQKENNHNNTSYDDAFPFNIML